MNQICTMTTTDGRYSKADHIGGSASGYQRDLRDVGGPAGPGEVNIRLPCLNIYAPRFCLDNARICLRTGRLPGSSWRW
jgi:hypothetical protein